jgi:cytochrome c-type biogenesis protein
MLDFIVRGVKDPSVLSVALSFLGGVLASLTPCVYPMIPVVVGIIGASSIDRKLTAFTLSLSYALGLSIVYSFFGLFAATTGRFFGEIATSPWSYLIFGNLCLVLGAWMMGWINIPFFSSGKTTTQKGHAGAFITGLLSGIVAAPCTSPVLGGLLIYISTTKDIILGGAMMFAFSIGMSLLLIIIGTSSWFIKRLPKPGRWMIWVKKGLALVLFGYGEYFLLKAGGLLI